MANKKWWEDKEQLRLLADRFDAINVDRRDFLKYVGAVGGSSAIALALAACGSSKSTPTTAAASTATSSSGGTTATSAATTAPTTASGTPAATSASTATTASTATSSGSADLAADQIFTCNYPQEPNSFDFNKDLYCNGAANLLRSVDAVR